MPSSALGWDDAWAAARAAVVHPGPVGRVSRVDGHSCVLLTSVEGPPRRALVPPSLGDDLAVGDWAVFTPDGPVHAVLPRRSLFARSGAGRETRRQPVAANIDTALIVNALDARLSVRRIERYLAVAWESGATPAVVLTKADLVPPDGLSPLAASVHAVALGVAVYVLGLDDDPAEVLAPCLAPGSTVALLGMSGAGKSTLLNRLAGADLAATQGVRSDGKGRHTTTARELLVLPGGALVIDTPGMRALALWDAEEGVEQVFADVAALAEECRFRDCAHRGEPGCAVQEAVDGGRLDADRVASWRKLQRELAMLAARQDARLRAERARQWKQISAASRSNPKIRGQNRGRR